MVTLPHARSLQQSAHRGVYVARSEVFARRFRAGKVQEGIMAVVMQQAPFDSHSPETMYAEIFLRVHRSHKGCGRVRSARGY